MEDHSLGEGGHWPGKGGEDFGERDKKERMEDKGKEEEREQREGIRQSTSCSLVPRPSHGKHERVWEIGLYVHVSLQELVQSQSRSLIEFCGKPVSVSCRVITHRNLQC